MKALIRAALVLAIAGPSGLGAAQTSEQSLLPPGHPPVTGGKFPALDGVTADALPENAPTGSLAVQAVQGTPDAPAIGGVHIDVNLVHRGMVVQTIEGDLDEHGVVVFDAIPLSVPVQPVVQIDYAGVTYQQAGAMLDAANRQQTVEVVCYEVTNDVPEWHISMRHVMLSHDPAGLKVTEVIVIENPSQRTWIGTQAEDAERLETVKFPLPAHAADVTLSKGFHGWCCTTQKSDSLVNHLPLMPETTELSFSYIVPVESALDVVAPANIDHMMVIVPDDVDVEEPITNLELGGKDVIADTSVRYYMGENLNKGDSSRLVLTRATASDSGSLARYVAGIGLGLIIIIGLIVVLMRPSKPPVEAT